jgi:hypothetical protein
MNINDRLDRIEQRLKPKASERVVICRYIVEPGARDRAFTRIRHSDREWLRVDGETEDAFRLRVEAEVALQPGCLGPLTMTMD